ncbi:hypothetical protein SKAU_G00107140 [Synaphobranchus kaupii]|uniref:Uncharacterized protein n=1 Tax=Synaphobranchus kaupii TaxID=118154 RepID=A0A9Q1G0S1_SYNKA|nr:hypothetical protein SKAU_G00107140 [Synaphobranchus kaupii]
MSTREATPFYQLLFTCPAWGARAPLCQVPWKWSDLDKNTETTAGSRRVGIQLQYTTRDTTDQVTTLFSGRRPTA